MISIKETDLNEAAANHKKQTTETKLKYESLIREMKKEFQHDIGIVDIELKRQTSTLKEHVAKLENKLMKSVQ
jgi:hypothetical protein